MALRADIPILLAKIEATYGTDPVPASVNGILATGEITIDAMEGEEINRQLQRPFYGAQPTKIVRRFQRCSFMTELVGGGSLGVAPGWGVLAKACGLSETLNAGVSVVYAPVTGNEQSATLYYWQDGTRHRMLGCRGEGAIVFPANDFPHIRWTFTGLWEAPTDTARVAPTLSGFPAPQEATRANTPTLTLGGVAMCAFNFGLTMGQKVSPRHPIGCPEQVYLTGREAAMELLAEAVPLATYNPWAAADTGAGQALNLVHGTVAGRIVTIAAPAVQLKKPSYRREDNLLHWPLSGSVLPVNGNDEFTITLT